MVSDTGARVGATVAVGTSTGAAVAGAGAWVAGAGGAAVVAGAPQADKIMLPTSMRLAKMKIGRFILFSFSLYSWIKMWEPCLPALGSIGLNYFFHPAFLLSRGGNITSFLSLTRCNAMVNACCESTHIGSTMVLHDNHELHTMIFILTQHRPRFSLNLYKKTLMICEDIDVVFG
jgi:hypothetical protein